MGGVSGGMRRIAPDIVRRTFTVSDIVRRIAPGSARGIPLAVAQYPPCLSDPLAPRST